MKIFIVEDDENIVELLGDELRAWGYETMSVKDFNNVAGEIEEFKSDLVLISLCRIITVFIGLKKSDKAQIYRLFSSLHTIIHRIWYPQCNSGRMTILLSRLISI